MPEALALLADGGACAYVASPAAEFCGGVRLGIIGLALGLPISLAATYFLQSRGTPTGDVDTSPSLVLVGGVIAGVVLVVASVTTLIPATRAARVNPVTALRSE